MNDRHEIHHVRERGYVAAPVRIAAILDELQAGGLSYEERDNAASAPLAAVVDSAFTWGDDQPPRTPLPQTLIYELHVKGFTRLHSEIPPDLQGTFTALGLEPAVRHLQQLGVTAVELLPVHHHVDDRHLLERGLVNYWGYNTLACFAPDLRYRSPDFGHTVHQFKTMVRNLHAPGIEIILDVVYNRRRTGASPTPGVWVACCAVSTWTSMTTARRFPATPC